MQWNLCIPGTMQSVLIEEGILISGGRSFVHTSVIIASLGPQTERVLAKEVSSFQGTCI